MLTNEPKSLIRVFDKMQRIKVLLIIRWYYYALVKGDIGNTLPVERDPSFQRSLVCSDRFIRDDKMLRV